MPRPDAMAPAVLPVKGGDSFHNPASQIYLLDAGPLLARSGLGDTSDNSVHI